MGTQSKNTQIKANLTDIQILVQVRVLPLGTQILGTRLLGNQSSL